MNTTDKVVIRIMVALLLLLTVAVVRYANEPPTLHPSTVSLSSQDPGNKDWWGDNIWWDDKVWWDDNVVWWDDKGWWTR